MGVGDACRRGREALQETDVAARSSCRRARAWAGAGGVRGVERGCASTVRPRHGLLRLVPETLVVA